MQLDDQARVSSESVQIEQCSVNRVHIEQIGASKNVAHSST